MMSARIMTEKSGTMMWTRTMRILLQAVNASVLNLLQVRKVLEKAAHVNQVPAAPLDANPVDRANNFFTYLNI
jgi:hypothetical protein